MTDKLTDLYQQFEEAKSRSPEAIQEKIIAERRRVAGQQERQQEAATQAKLMAIAARSNESVRQAEAATQTVIKILEQTLPAALKAIPGGQAGYDELIGALQAVHAVAPDGTVRRWHGFVKRLCDGLEWITYKTNPAGDLAWIEPVRPPTLDAITNTINRMKNEVYR